MTDRDIGDTLDELDEELSDEQHETLIEQDWLEFQLNGSFHFINLRRSEIESVAEVTDSTCLIVMSSGAEHLVADSYKNVVEVL